MKRIRKNKYIHYEVLTNQILGIMIGWIVVYLIYPILIPLGPATMATLSSIIFFSISYLRMYLVRLYFKSKEKERKWKK